MMVDGLPVGADVGGALFVELRLRDTVVERAGVLWRVDAGGTDSHVVLFDDEHSHWDECVCCGASVAIAASDEHGSLVPTCVECADRGRERIGVDYEYDELGWG